MGTHTETESTVVNGKPNAPIYEIRLKGHLDASWSEWFDGMTLTVTPSGETILIGPVVDQAMLHGILNKLRDLNVWLIAVVQH